MSVREYVGARYVPLFADPLDWDSTKTYEPLMIVSHLGNSYTSRQYVPAGIDISNTNYWALTGNYNAQIDQYRSEVDHLANSIDGIESDINEINTDITGIQSNIEDIHDFNDSLSITHHFHTLGYKDNTNNVYKAVQGGCYIGGDTLVIAMLNEAQNGRVLQKINYLNGTVSQQVVNNDIGHGQSLAYNADKGVIYIACYDDARIVTVSASTLQTVDINELTYNSAGIAYNDGKIYIAYGNGTNQYVDVYTDDFTFVKTILLKGFSNIILHGPIDLNIINDSIYRTTARNIEIYDINTGDMLKTIEIDRSLDYAGSIVEIEFTAFINNTDYVIGFLVYGSGQTGGMQVDISGFALHKDELNFKIYNANVTGWIANSINIYVDNTNTDYFQDGSQQHPYSTIHQAVAACVSNAYNKCVINIVSLHANSVLYANALACKNIDINSDSTIALNGIAVVNDTNIKINPTVNITANDFSRYYAGLTNAYFMLLNGGNLYCSSVSYNESAPAGIFVDNNSILSVGAMHRFDVSTVCIVRGCIRAKVGAVILNSGETLANSPNLAMGWIDGCLIEIPSNASTSVILPIAGKTGTVIGFLANGASFTVPVNAGGRGFNAKASDGTNINLTYGSATQRGRDLTIKSSSGNIINVRYFI